MNTIDFYKQTFFQSANTTLIKNIKVFLIEAIICYIFNIFMNIDKEYFVLIIAFFAIKMLLKCSQLFIDTVKFIVFLIKNINK